MDPLNEDVFPIENGDIPACYVSLPEARTRGIIHYHIVLILFWVVVSNIFDFHLYLGKILVLTHIFQLGWGSDLELSFWDAVGLTDEWLRERLGREPHGFAGMMNG